MNRLPEEYIVRCENADQTDIVASHVKGCKRWIGMGHYKYVVKHSGQLSHDLHDNNLQDIVRESVQHFPIFSFEKWESLKNNNMDKLIEKYLDGKHSVTIKDENQQVVFFEDADGKWFENEYNSDGQTLSYRNSDGGWIKREYNEFGRQISFADSSGTWSKSEFDSNGVEVFYKNSYGDGFDKRSKQMVPEEIVAQLKSLDQKQVIELIHLVIEQCHN